jgi:5'-nucleotidase
MQTPKVAEPIALVDMDGTLADYDLGMKRDLIRLCSPEEKKLVVEAADMHELEKLGAHWKHRMDMIKQQAGWWWRLPRMEDQFKVLNTMRRMHFDIHILTKGPWKTTSAWSEKVEWCREHTPYASVHISEDKGLVYGKVLMDDWPPYIRRWLTWRPRGLVIMPAHPWNEDFRHPNVVRWDGSPEAWAEIEDRLWAVRQTALYKGDDAPEIIRARGMTPCEVCHEPYADHPYDLGFLDYDRQPYVNVICDGTRVKL